MLHCWFAHLHVDEIKEVMHEYNIQFSSNACLPLAKPMLLQNTFGLSIKSPTLEQSDHFKRSMLISATRIW